MLHLANSNTTEGNISYTSGCTPHLDHVEVMVIGNPRIVPSPVGNGIHFTDSDYVGYKILVSEPWPCPFDINQCQKGVTLSFWFRWEYVVSTYYRKYITLGNTFQVYRASGITNTMVSLRWNVDRKFSWYFSANPIPGEWNLVMWKVNDTHSVGYLNGLKRYTRLKETRSNPSDIVNELHINPHLNAGNFSVGQMQLWFGGKSPVFMWRLYQEGLPDYDDTDLRLQHSSTGRN